MHFRCKLRTVRRLSNMDFDTDEYTALQKYISTYRDPKAAAAEENANKEDDVKPKKAWQVRDIAAGWLARIDAFTTNASRSSGRSQTPAPALAT